MTTPQVQRIDRTSATPSATGAPDGITFIGNATVLIRAAGLTILTDPNFVPAGERVPLGYGLSTTRLRDPAMGIDDLPPLDAVVLSHYHGDHFDRIAEERLDRAVPVVTTPQAATRLMELGFTGARGIETWASAAVDGPDGSLTVTSLPGRHAPSVLSIALPDVMGSLLEFQPFGADDPTLRIYVTGDTVMYEGLSEIPGRVPTIDVALIHLGGTRVMGVTVTMDADQGVELLELIRPTVAVPIHVDDYDAFTSPLEDFLDRAKAAGLGARIEVVERGTTLAF